MKTGLLILFLSTVTLSQDQDVYFLTKGGGKPVKVPATFLESGNDSMKVPTAQAEVDSSVYPTFKRVADSLDNFARLGHTHAGGSDPWTVYRRTADTTSSSATPATIGGMGFNVVSGTTYTFYYLLIY